MLFSPSPRIKITRLQDYKIFKHTNTQNLEEYFWSGNNKIDFFKKKIRFKEKDMCNKMSSSAMSCKNNQRGMRECDKDWKAKIEIQSTWEKKYILKYKPIKSIYTSIMKFRYIEDYEEMKKINEMLYEIMKKMILLPKYYSIDRVEMVNQMEEEAKNLLKLLEECNFLNIDFDDGEVFKNKFYSIYEFIEDRQNLDYNFRKLISEMKNSRYEGLSYLYVTLEKEIYPLMKKIYKELRRRGINKKY